MEYDNERLNFERISLDDLPKINLYLQYQQYRTCDYTIGGMFMWADYFKYEYAILHETLFIKGRSEINSAEVAFSLPLGKLPLDESIKILRDYCNQNNLRMVLSAIPEKAKEELVEKYNLESKILVDWADYLYDSQRLASLSGKAYNKKRNHVNRFVSTYPDFVYTRINESNIDDVIEFYNRYNTIYFKDSTLFQNEMKMTMFILAHYSSFNFTGALIKVDNKTIAFTIGEVLNDTLYIHIEKADKEYSGIYETINMKFVEDITINYDNIVYVNREEDVGDPGLRKSKQSYRPIALLNKYNLF